MRKLATFLGLAAMVCLTAFGQPKEVNAAAPTYSVKGQTITLKASNNADISEALDDALEEARDKASDAKKMTVVVPKGTYKISDVLHIFSNTTLDLSQGVTLNFSGNESHTMLMSGINGRYKGKSDYNESSLCKGYNGFKNITIKGGTWNSKKSNKNTIIRLFHAKNVSLENVVISGGGCAHQMEVAAIDGFYVKNCTFKDFGNMTKKTSEKEEALQLDIACSKDVFQGVYQDGTIMKNVEITGCTFSNVPRGVGSHTLLNGAYFTNIKINKNKFTNIAEEAIIGVNYADCEIKNNTIKNCGGGILFQYFKATPGSIFTTIFDGKQNYKKQIRYDANTVISGNTITTKYNKKCDEVQGIKVYGLNVTSSLKGRDGKTIPKGNYYVSNVTITNNNITTAGYGIHMMDTKKCKVNNNTIVGDRVSSSDPNRAKYDGIFVEKFAKNTTVTANKINNMTRNGIFVQETAYVSNLANNKISNCKRSGINFYMKSGTTNDVTKNSIKNCSDNGILVSTKCNVKNIQGNTISLKKAAGGITVFKDSIVGKIKDNTITNTSSNGALIESGIKLTTKATTGEISNNKIIASGKQNVANVGILVYSNSKVKGSMLNNSIGKVTANGVSISTNATVTGSISSNKIASAKNNGILLYNKAKVNKDITKNTITKVTNGNGISVRQKSAVKGSISKNSIKKVSGTKVQVDKTSSVGSLK